MKEITIQENDAGQRLDRFLTKTFPMLPKGMLFKAIRNKKIKVNRKRTQPDYRLEKGDQILLFLKPEFLEHGQPYSAISHGPLEIVYEDDEILVVNKPAGLLTVPDEKGGQDTLIGRITDYLIQSHQYDPKRELSFAPAVVSRLDRNTAGLTAAAKTASALRILNEGIREHKVHKFYKAWVEGRVAADKQDVHLYLKKEGTTALVQSQPAPGYVNADMKVRVLERKEDRTLIEVELLSGRFHQIRACMAYLGHPLIQDRKYAHHGNGSYSLEACRLIFDLPELQVYGKAIEL